MSVEDQVDGLRETSEGIASECDVTFELYRKFLLLNMVVTKLYNTGFG